MPTELPPRQDRDRPSLATMAAMLARLRVIRFKLWIVRKFNERAGLKPRKTK
jgi:hypothetical protein